MKIEKFNNYQFVNEEFIGGLVKGALGKLSGMFSAPFKDLSDDLKKLFKEDDPNSLKSILMTNINQAIDGAQKEINNIQDDVSILGIMDNMNNTLIQLSQNIGKDIDKAFTKDKTISIKNLASALLVGNKEADWVGLVGLIDPDKGILKKDINYKYSKKNYVNEVNKGKDLKAKKMIATKFLDDMQKSLQAEIDKDFTEEEIKKIFDESKDKNAQNESELDYTKLKELFDKKVPVIYLLKDKKRVEYNPKKKPEEQTNIVAVKSINSIDDKNKPDSVVFLDKYNKPTIKKSYSDIIGPVNTGENATKAKEVLGKIKDDEEKMGKVVKFAEFLQDDKNKDKISEIEKMITGQ